MRIRIVLRDRCALNNKWVVALCFLHESHADGWQHSRHDKYASKKPFSAGRTLYLLKDSLFTRAMASVARLPASFNLAVVVCTLALYVPWNANAFYSSHHILPKTLGRTFSVQSCRARPSLAAVQRLRATMAPPKSTGDRIDDGQGPMAWGAKSMGEKEVRAWKFVLAVFPVEEVLRWIVCTHARIRKMKKKTFHRCTYSLRSWSRCYRCTFIHCSFHRVHAVPAVRHNATRRRARRRNITIVCPRPRTTICSMQPYHSMMLQNMHVYRVYS